MVHTPYRSSTNAILRFSSRNKNKFLELGSANINLRDTVNIQILITVYKENYARQENIAYSMIHGVYHIGHIPQQSGGLQETCLIKKKH